MVNQVGNVPRSPTSLAPEVVHGLKSYAAVVAGSIANGLSKSLDSLPSPDNHQASSRTTKIKTNGPSNASHTLSPPVNRQTGLRKMLPTRRMSNTFVSMPLSDSRKASFGTATGHDRTQQDARAQMPQERRLDRFGSPRFAQRYSTRTKTCPDAYKQGYRPRPYTYRPYFAKPRQRPNNGQHKFSGPYPNRGTIQSPLDPMTSSDDQQRTPGQISVNGRKCSNTPGLGSDKRHVSESAQRASTCEVTSGYQQTRIDTENIGPAHTPDTDKPSAVSADSSTSPGLPPCTRNDSTDRNPHVLSCTHVSVSELPQTLDSRLSGTLDRDLKEPPRSGSFNGIDLIHPLEGGTVQDDATGTLDSARGASNLSSSYAGAERTSPVLPLLKNEKENLTGSNPRYPGHYLCLEDARDNLSEVKEPKERMRPTASSSGITPSGRGGEWDAPSNLASLKLQPEPRTNPSPSLPNFHEEHCFGSGGSVQCVCHKCSPPQTAVTQDLQGKVTTDFSTSLGRTTRNEDILIISDTSEGKCSPPQTAEPQRFKCLGRSPELGKCSFQFLGPKLARCELEYLEQDLSPCRNKILRPKSVLDNKTRTNRDKQFSEVPSSREVVHEQLSSLHRLSRGSVELGRTKESQILSNTCGTGIPGMIHGVAPNKELESVEGPMFGPESPVRASKDVGVMVDMLHAAVPTENPEGGEAIAANTSEGPMFSPESPVRASKDVGVMVNMLHETVPTENTEGGEAIAANTSEGPMLSPESPVRASKDVGVMVNMLHETVPTENPEGGEAITANSSEGIEEKACVGTEAKVRVGVETINVVKVDSTAETVDAAAKPDKACECAETGGTSEENQSDEVGQQAESLHATEWPNTSYHAPGFYYQGVPPNQNAFVMQASNAQSSYTWQFYNPHQVYNPSQANVLSQASTSFGQCPSSSGQWPGSCSQYPGSFQGSSPNMGLAPGVAPFPAPIVWPSTESHSQLELSKSWSNQYYMHSMQLGLSHYEQEPMPFGSFQYELPRHEVQDMGPVKTEVNDSGPVRSGVEESGPVRSGVEELGPVRSGVEELGPVRTGVEELAPVRTGVEELAPVRTGVEELAPVRTGVEELAPVRTGVEELAPVRTGVEELAPVRTGVEELASVRTGVELAPVRTGVEELAPVRTGIEELPTVRTRVEELATVRTMVEELAPVRTGVEELAPVRTGVEELAPVRTGVEKSGPVRTGVEKSGPVRTGVEESGPVRTGVEESGPVRTGVEELAPVRTGVEELAPVRTGVEELAPVRTGVEELGSVRTGVEELGPVRTGVEELGSVRTGVEELGSVRTGVEELGSVRTGVEELGPVRTGVEELAPVRTGVEELGSVRSRVEELGSVRSGVQELGSVRSGVQELGSVRPGVQELAPVRTEVEELGPQNHCGSVKPRQRREFGPSKPRQKEASELQQSESDLRQPGPSELQKGEDSRPDQSKPSKPQGSGTSEPRQNEDSGVGRSEPEPRQDVHSSVPRARKRGSSRYWRGKRSGPRKFGPSGSPQSGHESEPRSRLSSTSRERREFRKDEPSRTQQKEPSGSNRNDPFRSEQAGQSGAGQAGQAGPPEAEEVGPIEAPSRESSVPRTVSGPGLNEPLLPPPPGVLPPSGSRGTPQCSTHERSRGMNLQASTGRRFRGFWQSRGNRHPSGDWRPRGGTRFPFRGGRFPFRGGRFPFRGGPSPVRGSFLPVRRSLLPTPDGPNPCNSQSPGGERVPVIDITH
ncbi:uncharacterized protein LOC143031527 [Oratosquilla oratoria]|uniref:uncharacterized protein LOC143031527 n=1 Tax=Oratosquilla oratoria TaxID=337810 RepID=UPI003F76DBCB